MFIMTSSLIYLRVARYFSSSPSKPDLLLPLLALSCPSLEEGDDFLSGRRLADEEEELRSMTAPSPPSLCPCYYGETD